MTDALPADTDTAADADAVWERALRLLEEVYFDSGWSAALTPAALTVLQPLALRGPLTRAELDAGMRRDPDGDGAGGGGLDAEVWGAVEEWTDAELAELEAEFPGVSLLEGRDTPVTAAEAMAEDAALQQAQRERLDAHSAALGVAPVRTAGQLVDLLAACALLTVDEGGRYALNPSAPLPEEVLPLGPGERARLAKARRARAHGPTAQAVIALFTPQGGAPVHRLRTSLQRLARAAGVEVEAVRAAVLVLLEDGDFTASRDVAAALEHQVFELNVDWERFHATRLGIYAAGPGDDENPGDEDAGDEGP